MKRDVFNGVKVGVCADVSPLFFFFFFFSSRTSARFSEGENTRSVGENNARVYVSRDKYAGCGCLVLQSFFLGLSKSEATIALGNVCLDSGMFV